MSHRLQVDNCEVESKDTKIDNSKELLKQQTHIEDYDLFMEDEENFSSKRCRDTVMVSANNKLLINSTDTEICEGEYVDPHLNEDAIKMHAVLKNEDTIGLHRVEFLNQTNPIITFGSNELPIIDTIDQDTGERVRITAFYSYKREQYPKDTIIRGECIKFSYKLL